LNAPLLLVGGTLTRGLTGGGKDTSAVRRGGGVLRVVVLAGGGALPVVDLDGGGFQPVTCWPPGGGWDARVTGRGARLGTLLVPNTTVQLESSTCSSPLLLMRTW
jgi:hypothetical protein